MQNKAEDAGILTYSEDDATDVKVFYLIIVLYNYSVQKLADLVVEH